MSALSSNNVGQSIPADYDSDEDWSDAELYINYSNPVRANAGVNPTSQ